MKGNGGTQSSTAHADQMRCVRLKFERPATAIAQFDGPGGVDRGGGTAAATSTPRRRQRNSRHPCEINRGELIIVASDA